MVENVIFGYADSVNIYNLHMWYFGQGSFYMGAKFSQKPCLYTLKCLNFELSAENWKGNAKWLFLLCNYVRSITRF